MRARPQLRHAGQAVDSERQSSSGRPFGNSRKGETMKSTNGLIAAALLSLLLGMPSHAFAGTQCNVVGSYVIDVELGGAHYLEDLVLTGTSSALTGTLELVGGGSPWTIDSGSVVGDDFAFDGFFDPFPALRAHFSGEIAEDGTMGGTWEDTTPVLGFRSGTWATTIGLASCRDKGKHHHDRDKDERHHDRDNDDRRR
jgi:hypothetical protein